VLAQRVLVHLPLVAKTELSVLGDMLDQGLTHPVASLALLTDEARAALLHAARGLPRLLSHLLSHLLRLALLLASPMSAPTPQNDASIINSALILLHLGLGRVVGEGRAEHVAADPLECA
jgi:hypothetical protein